MNLYERITDKNFYANNHYYDININDYSLRLFTNKSCYKFIREYFHKGDKQKVFELSFTDKFQQEGKHIHTTILYFLGCYLKDMVEEALYKAADFNDRDEWFDFRYTWFLSCLYHDTASVIETEEDLGIRDNRFKELEYYLGKYNILYNVYDHIPTNTDSKLHTFPKDLVRNYFFYIASERKHIDHGILGGFILFDRLVKNYNSVWKQKKKIDSKANYNGFEYNNLQWRREHLDHFALIADSVIAHNIWFSKKENLYMEYGLNPIIVSDTNKISIKERPLLFFLSLLDTIEPTKRFEEKDPIEVMKSIEIIYEKDKKEVVISALDEGIDYNSYFERLENMKDWLKVEVGRNGKEVIIAIL